MAASMRRVSVVWFVALALALSLIGTLAAPVGASTIGVSITGDVIDNESGDCTLREAIAAANTNTAVDACPAGEAEPVVDTINVPAGTYTLANGELEVTESVAIVGAAPATTIIDGADEDRVFALDDGAVAISSVTITGGAAEDDDGGGILVGEDATLALTNSSVVDNHASDAGDGGGIFLEDGADATISGSIIGTVENPNTTDEDGGGIFVGDGSTLALSGGTTVTGNTAGEDGGGIYIDGNSQDASTVTITGSTISGNAADSDGGGIFVDDGSTATISTSTISGNAAESDGGGISVDGTATLTGTTVTANEADLGGGIYIDSQGTANVNAGSVVSNNDAFEGGGVANDGTDTLNLNGSTISGNEATGDGGGVWNRWDATANIVNSTIDSNTAGADSTDEIDGDGGGIFSGFCCGGELNITGSTISNNDAEGGSGGGIYSRGGLTSLLNSTVSGNTADNDGGGIFVDGTLFAQFTTVASNSVDIEAEGGGIWTQGNVGFYATIVANNVGGDCHHNDTGVDTLGSNLDTDDTCDFDHDDDLPDSNAKIDGLASNQPGTTQTHALQFDSPAVDAVEPASLEQFTEAEFLLVGTAVLPTCPATDQRGITRPQDGDSDGVPVCDIGAYELLPPAVSITDVTVTEGDTGTIDAVFTVTLSRPSTGTVTIAYATADGTATVVTDYQAKAGTVTFAPTDVSETIIVKVVGDTIDEPNEAFVVNLTAPFGATLLDAQGTGLILDDEGPIVTPAPTPRSDTLGSTLPNTGTGGEGLGGWGTGAAIGLVVLSATVLIRNRRRQTVRTR